MNDHDIHELNGMFGRIGRNGFCFGEAVKRPHPRGGLFEAKLRCQPLPRRPDSGHEPLHVHARRLSGWPRQFNVAIKLSGRLWSSQEEVDNLNNDM
jgi:hypothetical protein